jgi:hypothetical protein
VTKKNNKMVVNDSKGSCVEENNDKNHTSLPITTK